MSQITPQMRILVAIDAQIFRQGIGELAQVCRDVLESDPFSGWVFVFRNRRQTALRLRCYDGQGVWLAHKRFSESRFRWWPTSRTATTSLEAHQLQRLIDCRRRSGRSGRGAGVAPYPHGLSHRGFAERTRVGYKSARTRAIRTVA